LKLQETHNILIEDLQNCEHLERRRNDVELETEQALIQAKQEIKDLQKERLFVNTNRKDLEVVVHGF